MHTEKAYAKINLFLDVVGRRENGYHDLVSIMQTVSLYDRVTLSFTPGKSRCITLSATGNDAMPTDCKNLAWRAADRFLDAAGLEGHVEITIEKQIPMAAGLAGGSADCAAVLRGLNRICGSPLSQEALCSLGAKLGADVPFCIVGGMAYITGIGDRIRKIPSMQDCPMVVACMGEGVSTVWAYGKLDEENHFFTPSKEEPEEANELTHLLQKGDFSEAGRHFFNLFESVVPTVQPCVEPLKELMLKHDAIRSMMSGSGPSVFGVFKQDEDAEQACTAARDVGAAAFVCRPVGPYEF